jgi:hypothetical protein
MKFETAVLNMSPHSQRSFKSQTVDFITAVNILLRSEFQKQETNSKLHASNSEFLKGPSEL